MADSPTFVRTPSGFFAQAQGGLVPITDPVQLRDLQSGATPSITESPFSGTVANVASPTVPAYTQSTTPVAPAGSVPLSGNTTLPPAPVGTNAAFSFTTPAASAGSGASVGASSQGNIGNITVSSTGDPGYDKILGVPEGSPPPPPGTNPVTAFNTQIASILSQIQKQGQAVANNLSGAIGGITTGAVGAAGPYNPLATPETNLQNQTGTFGAFAPITASLAAQQQNTANALSGLSGVIEAEQKANLPQTLSPGESLVTPGGQVIRQGHQYTPQINPITGLLDGFDVNTGTFASDDAKRNTGGGTPSAAGSPTDGTASAIESVFGSSNPIGAYATDPNYVPEISSLYNTVSSLGVAQNPEGLQQYINNNAKGAPVTSQMILNAASTYGIDPALLTTVLLHESDFGTAGAAKSTNNPGNVGNTGTSTQTFASWQQGVLAAAKNIATRMAAAAGAGNGPIATPQTSQGTTGAATSPVGGSFTPEAAKKVSQLPSALQNFVDSGPLGVAYINADRVPDTVKGTLQTLSSRAGIPFVKDTDVGALKSIDTVLSNLDNMETLANNTLVSGPLGHLYDATVGRGEQALQTPAGIQLGLFDNYRDVAIKAVQALAGGAGSGLRINMGEIAANTQNLPQATDSKENAIAQIKQLKQLIYTQLSTTFPYAPVGVIDSKGNVGTIPVSNLSTALSRGATIQ